jgi:hemolysin III
MNQSKLREPVNALTHLFAALAAAAGLALLVVLTWGNWDKLIPLAIYGVSLIALFSASAAYHSVRAGDHVIQIMRKLDHSAIFLLIAGTYTPFCLNAFTGFWKWGLLSIIWALAAIGIVVKIFYMRAPRWLNAGIYVLMGWLCLAAIGEMLAVLPAWVLSWMVIGGVLYTLGAVVYATKKMDFWPGVFGFHEVWHIFVILAAAAHFIAVLGVAT